MSFPVSYTFPVAWGDMDAYGHVNNVNYLRYFESARVRYFEEMNAMQMGETGDIKPVLASISCQYKRPVVYPDQMTCLVRTKQLGNSSLVMECEMHSQKVGLAAVAECVIVMFDFKNERPTRVPEPLRQAIEKLEGKG